MANHQLIINPNPVIINLPALHRSFGEHANHQLIVNRSAAIISPTARKHRHVAQPICRQFADHSWEFADSVGFEVIESTDNPPILALAELRNPSTYWLNPSIRPSEPERRIVRYSSDDLWETSDCVARGTSRRPAAIVK